MPYPTKKLGEVLEKNGIIPAKIKRDDYRQSGKYPVVDQGENLIAGYIDDEQKLYRGDLPVIIFGDHTRVLKYVDFPFAFGADGIKILRPQEILLPKFFYYTLIFNPVANQGYKRHFSLLVQTKIPLPPLATQKQIVDRLDKITEAQKLNDELIQKTDELFQSLLHQELNPAGKDWEVKKLGEISEIYQPKTITSNEILKTGPYKVFGANGVIGYYSEYNHEDAEVLVTCRGATCGTLNMSEPKSWITGNAMVVHPKNEKLLLKWFLYYALSNSSLSRTITGTGQPQITRNSLAPFQIPLPPLAIQKQIVAKLSAVQEYKTQLLDQKSKLKELFDSALAKSFKSL